MDIVRQSCVLTASIAPAIPPAVIWVANPTGFFLSPFLDIFDSFSSSYSFRFQGKKDKQARVRGP